MMAAALRRAGRSAFSDPSFAPALERLLKSYEEEADLSLFGSYATCFDVMRCLSNLLRLDAAEEENPAIRSAVVRQPVFITGLPRSATTFFHSLLAQDPENVVPRCWRLIHPYPPEGSWAASLRKAQVELQLGLFRWATPGIGELHPLSADTPQECTDITAHSFQSLRSEAPIASRPIRLGWTPRAMKTPSAVTGAFSSIFRSNVPVAGSSNRRIMSLPWMPSGKSIPMRKSCFSIVIR